MSQSGGYIHGGTDAREVARLEKQSVLTWKLVGDRFIANPGERVLDLATGVGAMAGQLLEHRPGIHLVGVDLRMPQLQSAQRNHPGAAYVQADGGRLPFRDGTFDRIHCSWLLEHVREPVAILREARRVLRQGGTCHFIEVDNATFRTVPADPDIDAVLALMNQAQIDGGGDPFVGQKLDQLFRDAGFEHVSIERCPLEGSHANPARFREAVEEFAEIFEGLDESLGAQNAARAQLAAQKLRSLLERPGTQMHYAGVLAVAR